MVKPTVNNSLISMELGFDISTIATGILVFLARIFDVTMGTIRTISIVHGRAKTAFVLGFLEISVWLLVISTVIDDVFQKPLLGIFYALGFSAGNVVGILVERHLAYGHLTVHVISTSKGAEMANIIRKRGYGVTTFKGEGMRGPVTLLYIVCLRKQLRCVLRLVTEIDPDAFYTIEQTGQVSKILRPIMLPATGWRAIVKKK